MIVLLIVGEIEGQKPFGDSTESNRGRRFLFLQNYINCYWFSIVIKIL